MRLNQVSSIAVCALFAFGCSSSDRGSSGTGGTGNTGNSASGGQTSGTGGAGGTTTAGGAGGKAPATDLCAAKGVKADGTDGLIDDLEDNNISIRDADHRTGTWNASGDSGCTPTPAFAPAAPLAGNVSHYAAHASESGCNDYGHSIALTLNGQGAGACGYDATNYDGVYFWVAAAQPTTILFNLHTSSTIPMQYGGDGTCDQNGTAAVGCWNGFAASVDVTSTWTLKSFKWADLKQDPTWGTKADFDVTKTAQMSWSHAKPGGDFWLDNVGFFSGTAPAAPPAPGSAGGAGGAAP